MSLKAKVNIDLNANLRHEMRDDDLNGIQFEAINTFFCHTFIIKTFSYTWLSPPLSENTEIDNKNAFSFRICMSVNHLILPLSTALGEL